MPKHSHPELLSAQLSEIADRDRHSTVVGVPAVLTVVWMHLGHVPNSQIYGWMAYMFAVMAVRFAMGQRWGLERLHPNTWRPALRWRLIASAFYGLGWGGSMLVLNTYNLDVLTTFKIGTLTAALGIMLNSMSVIFSVYIAFLLPCWLSLMIYIFAVSGFLTEQDALICGVAATIFGIVLMGSSYSIARLTRMFFLSKFDLDQALTATRESHEREKVLSLQLAEQARRDALTGAYNRRYLAEQLDYQVSVFLRNQQPFSLVLIDIDHFKRINDQYGHDAGDLVLKAVTSVMSSALREIDIFGRWGGEEFLCILPNTHQLDAQQCAERLRISLEKAQFTEIIANLQVTVSLGVSTFKTNDNAADIVKRCDLALYRAKAEGRNRVMLEIDDGIATT
jgi:diguanylate cyclase (GGDEF)-like protein